MATLANINPTLLDWQQALDPNGMIAPVIELLNKTNEVLADISFIEGNLPTGHIYTVRTGLPGTTWRKLYQGVQPDKSQRARVTESVGWQEAYNEIDAKLVELNGNGQMFRLQEAAAQTESMGQELARTIFYGDTEVYPERFTGLSPRYNDKSAKNAKNILDAGGTGSDNRSIWLVCWSPMGAFGIVPKGSNAGLQVEDKGRVTSESAGSSSSPSNTNRNLMEVFRMRFQWDAGMGLADWRYCVRIANIDFSNLSADASTGANLPNLMAQALRRIPRNGIGMMRKVFYMENEVLDFLEQQLSNAVRESTLTVDMVGGVETTMFKKVPLRQVDALATNEARVT